MPKLVWGNMGKDDVISTVPKDVVQVETTTTATLGGFVEIQDSRRTELVKILSEWLTRYFSLSQSRMERELLKFVS